MTKVRVLVVDDSPTMRGIISASLRRDPDVEVCGTAGDPYEAREAIKQQNPDVVTLDVEMPKMDGLSFLEKIMRLRPTPVIMISTRTEKGAAISVEALRLGAFECVCKPQQSDMARAFRDLPALVKAAAKANLRNARPASKKAERVSEYKTNRSLIAIGSSTGGVEALSEILPIFPENCPPTVITQHMPEGFTKTFAKRLNGLCAPKVERAYDGAPLEPGHVYLAPGGATHLEVTNRGGNICRLIEGDKVSGHRPSVDVLFHSVAGMYGKRAVGAILTGMGRDGAAGMLAMREAGARTVGQNESTCVVYGMPRVAYEYGGVEMQLPLDKIARELLKLCDGVQARKAA